MSTFPRVGVLGLGIMGSAMANRFLSAGYRLTVWNRSSSRCEPFVAKGAAVASNPAAVVKDSDFIISMVSDPTASRIVALCDGGVAEGLRDSSRPKTYIDMSTVDAETAITLATVVAGTGGQHSFLEAPVSGSKAQAESGALVVLCGGDKAVYDAAAAAIFPTIAKTTFHLGVVGRAAVLKLLVNNVMVQMTVALADGVTAAALESIDPFVLVEVLKSGAMASPLVSVKGPLMAADAMARLGGETVPIEEAFPPAFPLKHAAKDMRLAAALGRVPEVTSAAFGRRLLTDLTCEGGGDADFSALIRALRVLEPVKQPK